MMLATSEPRVRALAGLVMVTLACAAMPSLARAHGDRVSRRERNAASQPEPPAAPTNVHLAPAGVIALPGRGQSLAWSPDGRRIAVGGHFREKATRLRYDTRIANVATGVLEKSFACHWYWAVAQAWVDHPDYGELLADGGGDHAVKVWNPGARGSSKCNPGQFLTADGALEQLGDIDGWIVSLAFSPDRKWLAGASRDRTIRIWQIAPGRNAWQVVALWFDPAVGNFLSVDWAPDGRGVVTGDRRGRVAVWDFDPEHDPWDDATVSDFARLGYEQQARWFRTHATLTTRIPRWSETGHSVVWNARWSPDGSRVAAGGTDGTVSVYDARDGSVLLRQTLPRGKAAHGLAWHPLGRWLAAGASDTRIYVYDTAAGGLADTLVGHADVVTALAWSPDGERLASTAGGPLLQLAIADVSQGPDQSVRLWRWR
jgi:WD40 repeat protein